MIWDEVFWVFFIIACIFVLFTLIESYSLMNVIYITILIMLGVGKLAGEIHLKRNAPLRARNPTEIKVKKKILDELKE